MIFCFNSFAVTTTTGRFYSSRMLFVIEIHSDIITKYNNERGVWVNSSSQIVNAPFLLYIAIFFLRSLCYLKALFSNFSSFIAWWILEILLLLLVTTHDVKVELSVDSDFEKNAEGYSESWCKQQQFLHVLFAILFHAF